MANDVIVRVVVVLFAAAVVFAIARFRPSRRPAALKIDGNLEGPGVFLFTSETCDSCHRARARYREVLGDDGFVEYTWEAEPALLSRLGVEEIPVGSVVGAAGQEIAAFRLVPSARALRRAVAKAN